MAAGLLCSKGRKSLMLLVCRCFFDCIILYSIRHSNAEVKVNEEVIKNCFWVQFWKRPLIKNRSAAAQKLNLFSAYTRARRNRLHAACVFGYSWCSGLCL